MGGGISQKRPTYQHFKIKTMIISQFREEVNTLLKDKKNLNLVITIQKSIIFRSMGQHRIIKHYRILFI